MPAFRHKATGVLVTVSDERAGLLGSEWAAADEKPKPTPRRRKSKSDDD